MRLGSLSAELDSITREFDYGIVPGSATVFVRDELNGIGRLDLTLLEGVMIVLEVTDQGYKVTSCSPLCNVDPALSTAQTVQAHLEAPFESMENLLMTISPMFRDRFQQALFDKLQSVQTQQQLDAATAAAAAIAASHDPSLPHPSATLLHQQQIFAQNHAPPSNRDNNSRSGSSSSHNNTNSDNNIQNLHHTSDEVSFDELNHWIN